MADRGATGLTAASAALPRTPLSVEIRDSAADIPEEAWRHLAPPGDPTYGRAFFLAMERGGLGPDAYGYLLLRTGERIAAILPYCVFGALPLEDIVGKEGRRALRPIRWILRRPPRIKALMCGHLLSAGRVLRADGPSPGPAAAGLLIEAVGALARRHGARWTVLKDFVRADLDWLRPELTRHGFFCAPGLPDAVLEARAPTFDGHVATLSGNARHSIRANRRKFARQADTSVEVRDRFADLVPEMLPLYHAVLDRAETRLDVWTAQFLTALSEDPGIAAKAVLLRQRDQLVGFLVCLIGTGGSVALRIGLDYGCANDLRLYHVAHYRCIEEALAAGCTTVNLTQTTYTPKLRMGCHLVPLEHAVTHRNPLLRTVLRRFLPLALNRSGQEA